MQIQHSNNQQNFGIRIKNPKKFSNELLEAVVNSPMTKQIDEEYPKASLEYWFNSHHYNTSKPYHVLTLNLHAPKIKGDSIGCYNKTYISAETYEGLIERLAKLPKEVSKLLEDRNNILEANQKTSTAKYKKDRKNLLNKTANSFWGYLKNAIFGTRFIKSDL